MAVRFRCSAYHRSRSRTKWRASCSLSRFTGHPKFGADPSITKSSKHLLQIGNRHVLLFSVAMRHVVPSALMRCVRSPPPSCVERRGKERGNGAWVIHGLRFRAVLRASLFPGPLFAPRPHTAPFCQKRRPEKARGAVRSSTAPSSGSLPIALWARGNHHKPAPEPTPPPRRAAWWSSWCVV